MRRAVREVRGTAGPPGSSAREMERGFAHDRFELSEGRVILGAASGHEARAGVAAPEADRTGRRRRAGRRSRTVSGSRARWRRYDGPPGLGMR